MRVLGDYVTSLRIKTGTDAERALLVRWDQSSISRRKPFQSSVQTISTKAVKPIPDNYVHHGAASSFRTRALVAAQYTAHRHVTG